ncbi:hypothetical protein K0M31_018930 [Melipona bicolor]|uniref:Uncharacterized protein n=1 Tax=Melipona bicolor TaxID=60889 RepID=A0AA40KSE1_9HYME|nr:hypothetical protein K0M31_018930 [Melipona bicolor]
MHVHPEMLLARTEGRRAPQVSHKYASRRIETERKPPRTETTVSQFELSTFAGDTARVVRRFADESPPPPPPSPLPAPSPPRRILVERVTKALGPADRQAEERSFSSRGRTKTKKKRWTHTRKTAHSRLSVILYSNVERKKKKKKRKKTELYCACVRADHGHIRKEY